MSDVPYSDVSRFFRAATGEPPYAWQRRLAAGRELESGHGSGSDRGRKPDYPMEEQSCESLLINVPTGLGKTAGVVLAWLWNYLPGLDGLGCCASAPWPRRLVYCLPMRTLVEQTEKEVRGWLGNLVKACRAIELSLPEAAVEKLLWLAGESAGAVRSPVVLMGGVESDRDWDVWPEKPTILIGTQDMLLSRALNRGYGMSRYRWPMHFGLLNNDALWVVDEVQLMGAGMATTAQLEAFRSAMATLQPTRTWWMSATVRLDWLRTVDFEPETGLRVFELSAEENREPEVVKRRQASKPVARAIAPAHEPKQLAEEIVEATAAAEGLTLVVVNTVDRARELHRQLGRLLKDGPPPLLIHSRFRPPERKAALEELERRSRTGTGIVVSTQVVEAGVDISAQLLFTELAPWASLIQRFGRCNRFGNQADARVLWVDVDSAKAAPYSPELLDAARGRLLELDDAAPGRLVDFPFRDEERPEARHLLRRKDLIDLFDTTPDLAGNDIDIDRFIRDGAERNALVFWRDWEGGGGAPDSQMADPARDELCQVPVAELAVFARKHVSVFQWEPLAGTWVRADRFHPGRTYVVHAGEGGYSIATGWDPKAKGDASLDISVSVVGVVSPSRTETPEADAGAESAWQSLREHTDRVCAVAGSMAALAGDWAPALSAAARLHDWGKAHPAFEAKLRPEALERARRDALIVGPPAKAPLSAWRRGPIPAFANGDARRVAFRHELAGALAILQPGVTLGTEPHFRDLVAYLVAAHHGQVRLSIRALPTEPPPTAEEGLRFARGVWEGDVLPAAELGGDLHVPALTLSLEPMEIGLGEQPPFRAAPSWLDRMLTLRDLLGPFRLAYLETLLRAADARGSMEGERA